MRAVHLRDQHTFIAYSVVLNILMQLSYRLLLFAFVVEKTVCNDLDSSISYIP